MSEFKLIKDLGLNVRKLEYLHQPPEYVVSANDLETILAEGVQVAGWQNNGVGAIRWVVSGAMVADTHTGLLINVKPIVKDTAESLLRDYLTMYNARHENEGVSVRPWIERVERLLGEK